jgi:hypothetical protein
MANVWRPLVLTYSTLHFAGFGASSFDLLLFHSALPVYTNFDIRSRCGGMRQVKTQVCDWIFIFREWTSLLALVRWGFSPYWYERQTCKIMVSSIFSNPPSYKNVLLGYGGFDHRERLSLSSSVKDNATAQKPEFRKDDWQVMKSKRPWPYTMPQVVSDTRRQQERCLHFLQKIKEDLLQLSCSGSHSGFLLWSNKMLTMLSLWSHLCWV